MLILAQGLVRATDQLFLVNYTSVCQALTPDHLQGRVTAASRVFTAGTVPAGAFVGGLLGEAVGMRATGVTAAAGVALACLWVLLSSVRILRRLPDRVPPPPDPG
jgi:predicted MFS family arabinose efflux permease